MKNFFKNINWKKFLKYELYAILIVGLLYAYSVWQGRNIFPENFYVVWLIPAMFGFMMLIKTFTVMMELKINKSKK